jgi:hypothetical protein
MAAKVTLRAFAVLDDKGKIATAGLTMTHLQVYTTDDNNGARTQSSPEAVIVPCEITYHV